MSWIFTKYLLTAGLVVFVSEIAKRSDKLGALVAALPLVTILTLFWLYFESQPSEKIANHAYYTFWYVIPTLPMFIAFPWFMARIGFWGAMGLSVLLTAVSFVIIVYVAKAFGVDLLS